MNPIDTTVQPAQGASIPSIQTHSILTATLRGNARQRGEQHGLLFERRVKDAGILEFYRDYVHRHMGGGMLRTEALELLHSFFAARLSPMGQDLVVGYGRSSKIDPVEVARAAVLPDVMNFLIGSSGSLTGPVVLGGTSAAAWGDYTQGGRMLHGRNLDGPGHGTPLVCRHYPDSGQPYVTVGAPGLVVDGLTGVNEAGLTMAFHQHANTEVSRLPSGRSVVDLGCKLLQTATTLDEALSLAKEWKHCSAWSIVLTHWPTKRAAIVELSPGRAAVTESAQGMLVQANTFRDPDLRRAEIDSPAFREGSIGRGLRAEALLAQGRGRIDAAALSELLDDHRDSERSLTRGFLQTIAQPHNEVSVVFDPEHGALWLAEGPAAAGARPYRRVALWADEAPGEALPGRIDPLTAEQRLALASYQAATRSWEASDEIAALEALERSVALDPQDPAYRLLRGLLALRCAEPASAAESLEAGAALPDLPHRRDVQRLWQARALDLAGERGRAEALYQDLGITSASTGLRLAAVTGLEAAYSGGPIRPDFYHGDSYGY